MFSSCLDLIIAGEINAMRYAERVTQWANCTRGSGITFMCAGFYAALEYMDRLERELEEKGY